MLRHFLLFCFLSAVPKPASFCLLLEYGFRAKWVYCVLIAFMRFLPSGKESAVEMSFLVERTKETLFCLRPLNVITFNCISLHEVQLYTQNHYTSFCSSMRLGLRSRYLHACLCNLSVYYLVAALNSLCFAKACFYCKPVTTNAVDRKTV